MCVTTHHLVRLTEKEILLRCQVGRADNVKQGLAQEAKAAKMPPKCRQNAAKMPPETKPRQSPCGTTGWAALVIDNVRVQSSGQWCQMHFRE
jgi:hypothetical protein